MRPNLSRFDIAFYLKCVLHFYVREMHCLCSHLSMANPSPVPSSSPKPCPWPLPHPLSPLCVLPTTASCTVVHGQTVSCPTSRSCIPPPHSSFQKNPLKGSFTQSLCCFLQFALCIAPPASSYAGHLTAELNCPPPGLLFSSQHCWKDAPASLSKECLVLASRPTLSLCFLLPCCLALLSPSPLLYCLPDLPT